MGHPKRGCPGRVLLSTIRGLVSGLFGGAAVVGGADLFRGNTIEEAWETIKIEAPIIAFNSGVLMLVYTMLECTIEYARDTVDAANSFIAGGITGAIYGSPLGPEQMVTWAIIFSIVCGVLDGIL